MKTLAPLEELYGTDPRTACQFAIVRTSNVPERDRMDEINKLLGLFGTEAIRGEWQNGYWCDIVAVYCNTGDMDSLTVIQVRGETRFDHSTFEISSWGNWVEKNSEKYNLL